MSHPQEDFGFHLKNGKRESLGSGISGTSYLGWVTPADPNLRAAKINAALKEYNKPVISSLDAETHSAKQEALKMSGLQHRNIAKYLGYFLSASYPVLATEEIVGSTIRNLVEEREKSPAIEIKKWHERILIWTYQLAQALVYLHRNGVCHLDVTPDNVMISRMEDHPILIDFGSSRREKEDGELMFQLSPMLDPEGTMQFVSPEQLRSLHQEPRVGASEINGQADVYSLGVLLAYMVNPASVPDFGGKEKEVTFSLASRAIKLELLAANEEIVSLVQNMTAYTPDERPDPQAVIDWIYGILERHFDELPPIERIPNIAPPPASELPKFKLLGDGVHIAVTPMSCYEVGCFVDDLPLRMEDEAAFAPIRMTHDRALNILEAINAQEEDSPWIYRLADWDEWYRSSGGGAGQGRAGCLFDDIMDEYEWLYRNPGNQFPECRGVAFSEDSRADYLERHSRWPKGAIRLVKYRDTTSASPVMS